MYVLGGVLGKRDNVFDDIIDLIIILIVLQFLCSCVPTIVTKNGWDCL